MAAPLTAYDRPSVAAANLMAADPYAAWLALVSPDNLSPNRRRTVGEKVAPQVDNPLKRAVVEAFTNPLLVVGALMALKWPVPTAENLFAFKGALGGYARSVGPVGRFLGDVNDLYRGTPIPKLYYKIADDVANFRAKHLGALGEAYQEAVAKAGGSKLPAGSLAKVAAKLDGLDDPGSPMSSRLGGPLFDRLSLSPAEQSLFDRVRPLLNRLWDEGMPKNNRERARVQAALGHQRLEDVGLGEHQAWYFPHQKKITKGDFDLYVKRMVAGGEEQAGFKALGQTEAQASRSALKRRFAALPNPEELTELLGAHLRPGAAERIVEESRLARIGAAEQWLSGLLKVGRPADSTVAGFEKVTGLPWAARDTALSILGGRGPEAEGLAKRVLGGVKSLEDPVHYYTLDLTNALEAYIHGLSRQYGWTLGGQGARLRKEIELVESPVLQHIMRDTYVPILLGRNTFHQAVSAMAWGEQRRRLVTWLDGSEGAKKLIGPATVNWFKKVMLNPDSAWTLQNIQGKITGYFYLSTLGANPASAAKNMLQGLITTMPMVGPKAWAEGMAVTVKKAEQYARLRAEGVGHLEALAKANPEFAASGLEAAPIAEQAISGALEDGLTGGRLNLGRAGRNVEQVKQALMSAFTASERFNRWSGYEAGLVKARHDGLGAEAAKDFAVELTRRGQFPAGPGNVPAGLANLPSVWRQFLTFPAKFAQFLGASTAFGGSGGRDFGTIGRALVGSTVAYEAARHLLGVDLSGGLLFGALPLPSGMEGQVLAPIPVVPPAVGALAGGAQALATGSTKPLKFVLPTLVPLGIEANRLRRTFLPPYADFDHPNGQGQYPLYGEGGGLIGYFTKSQLMLKGLGFAGMDIQREQDLMGYLAKQRDAIREYRRRYVEKIVDNDATGAEGVAGEFRRQYPDLGPIQVKDTDLRAAELRRQVPRVQRLLETMPAEYRGNFQQLVATAFAEEGGNLAGRAEYPADRGRGQGAEQIAVPGAANPFLHPLPALL